MSRNKDLASALTDKHGLSKQDAEKFVSAMFGLLNDALSKEKIVKIKGLGTFKVVSVAPRKSVDVNTGASIVIDGRDKITFTPDASMRDEVNKPFAQFETVIVNDGVDFSEIDRKFSEEEKEEEEKEKKKEENNEQIEVKSEEKIEEEPKEKIEEKPKEKIEVEEKEVINEEKLVEEVASKVEEVSSNIESNTKEEIVEPATVVETEQQDNSSQTDTDEQPEEQHTEKLQVEEEQREEPIKQEIEVIEKETEKSHQKLTYLLVACIAVMLICLGGAFYMFSQLQKRDNRIANLEAQVFANNTSKEKKSNKTAVKTATPSTKQDEVLTKDILTASADNPSTVEQQSTGSKAQPANSKQQSATNQQSTQQAVAKQGKEKSLAKNAEAQTNSRKADLKAKAADNKVFQPATNYSKDPRIRTGAYNIVGIDKTVTVKAGQTLSSISKFYFGPGMECYVEAVNGGKTEFKAGDKIKIPQIKHKKR